MRPFYKMELPVIGKRTDVCNKKAIIALSRGEDDEALRLWEEAIKMKDEHFDSKMNFLMYKWRTGSISDDELVSSLQQQEVFNQSDIGAGLKGIVKLCVGEIQEGAEILNKIAQPSAQDENSGELRNLKVDRFKQQVVEICEVMGREKERFISNRVIFSMFY